MLRFEMTGKCIIGEEIEVKIPTKELPGVSRSTLLIALLSDYDSSSKGDKLCRVLARECTHVRKEGVCVLSDAILRCPFQNKYCSDVKPEDWETYLDGVRDGMEAMKENTSPDKK